MYDAALLAIERRVPSAMFRRPDGGELVYVEVGDHRAVLEVGEVSSRASLHDALARVAEVLVQHVDPADIEQADGALL